MIHTDDERSVESALSILVVAVVLGIFADVAARTGQSLFFYLIRERGWSVTQVSGASWLWTWAGTLGAASSWGKVIALWRLSRSVMAGRARGLARAALWIIVVHLVLSGAWQIVVPWGALRWGSGERQWIFALVGSVSLGLALISTATCFATVIVLVRGTGRAPAGWPGLVAIAAVAELVDIGWFAYGYGRLVQWPVVCALVGAAAAALRGLGVLVFLLPMRRAWRGLLVGTAGVDDGPYRLADIPRASWRTADELSMAGAGLAEVRRRFLNLAALTGAAAPIFYLLFMMEMPRALMAAALVLGAIQVRFVVPLLRGLARVTRAPLELPGRALAIAALLCGAGSLVSSLKSLCGLAAVLFEVEVGSSLLGSEGIGGAAVFTIGIVLLVVALARAARAFDDHEVIRRAWTTLGVYAAAVALAVVVVHAVLSVGPRAPSIGLPLFVGGTFVVAVVCLALCAWLLDAGARMLGKRESSPEEAIPNCGTGTVRLP